MCQQVLNYLIDGPRWIFAILVLKILLYGIPESSTLAVMHRFSCSNENCFDVI